MATPPQLTNIPFAAGLDESTEDEILNPTTGFAVLENVRQDKRGGATKRLGYDSLPATRLGDANRATGRRLFSHRGRTCVIDGQYLDTFIETADTSVKLTRVSECDYDLLELPTPRPTAILDDSEACNGYTAISSRGDSVERIAYVTVVETSTGATVVPAVALDDDGPAIIRLASFSSRYFIAFLLRIDTNDLFAYSFDTQSLTSGWSLIGTVAGGISTGNIFNCCSLSDRAAVAYATTTGTSRVGVRTVALSGVLASATINTSSTTPGDADIHGSSSGTLWVIWTEGASANEVKVCGLTPSSLATVSTSATVYTDADPVPAVRVREGTTNGTARALIATDISSTVMADLLTVTGATTTPNGTVTVHNAKAFSKPFLRQGRYYAAFYAGSVSGNRNSQSVLIVADWTDNEPWLRPVAYVEPGLVTNADDSLSSKFCDLDSLNSNTWGFAFQLTKAGTTGPAGLQFGEAVSGFKLLRLDFVASYAWQSASRSDGTFLGGALTSAYDGEVVTEASFLVKPSTPSAQDVSPAFSGITGTFRYVAVYEAADAVGNWAISGVSNPTGPLSLVSEDALVLVRPLTVTMRPNSTSITIYRTLDGGEPPYYRVQTLANDLTVATVEFTDDMPDATLATKALLYAPSLPGVNGGAQDRRAPPGLRHICAYNGMLVGSTGSTLWFSAQHVEGEAAWFSPIFQVPIEDAGDGITGLAVQDGTLYAFSRQSIYAITGEAPSDNAASGGLGSPRRLASDVGCIDASSIVVTSAGVFFQSERGIEVLSRGGQVAWVGEQVQRTLAAYPVVSSAVLDERNSIVRFSLAGSRTSGGTVADNGRDVIYDLSIQQWVSVDDKRGSSTHEPSQDAAIITVGGVARYAWLSTDGIIYYERLSSDADAHLDGSTWITMSAETSWFKQSGLQGKQVLNHVLALARKYTDHDLSISLSYNYETTFRTARTWSRAFINTLLLNGWPITQLKHEPHDDNRCQSFRVRLEDVTPSSGTVGSGRGATWLGLTFDVTPEPGIFDVPEEAA